EHYIKNTVVVIAYRIRIWKIGAVRISAGKMPFPCSGRVNILSRVREMQACTGTERQCIAGCKIGNGSWASINDVNEVGHCKGVASIRIGNNKPYIIVAGNVVTDRKRIL